MRIIGELKHKNEEPLIWLQRTFGNGVVAADLGRSSALCHREFRHFLLKHKEKTFLLLSTREKQLAQKASRLHFDRSAQRIGHGVRSLDAGVIHIQPMRLRFALPATFRRASLSQ